MLTIVQRGRIDRSRVHRSRSDGSIQRRGHGIVSGVHGEAPVGAAPEAAESTKRGPALSATRRVSCDEFDDAWMDIR
jgi:hypothetical protein